MSGAVAKQKYGNIVTGQEGKPLKSWEIRRLQQQNLDNFKFIGRKNEVLIKKPGDGIKGQQFMIDQCSGCTIFLLDNISTITIDDCKDCRIFVAPCTSSLFLRTTTNSTLQVACGQFRSRDCYNCDILLYSQSQPVIESSDNLRFGCFQFYYPELAQQFRDAGLSVWKNNWSDLYDFTKKPGRLHFSYLKAEFRYSALPDGVFSFPAQAVRPVSEAQQQKQQRQ